MLAATGGVNTHRGAIFALGLLCAAVAAAQAGGASGAGGGAVRRIDVGAETDGAGDRPAAGGGVRVDAEVALPAAAVRAALTRHWGDALARRSLRAPSLPGGIAARRLGLRSASQEAALGLPIVFDHALPAWRRARALGLAGTPLRLQVFFEILAVLDDSNLARRGGLDGLRHAQAQARAFLAGGGAARDDAAAHAWAIHRDFVARRLSPGGVADMLSAACLLDRLGAIGPA